MSFIFFIFFILFLIVAIVLSIGASFFRMLFRSPDKRRTQYGNYNKYSSDEESKRTGEHKKVFKKDEGEYIDYEEIE